jgi:hypothetical protein
LEVKLKDGQVVLQTRDLPDLAEAKRLWMSGKSAQYILEQMKREGKSKR